MRWIRPAAAFHIAALAAGLIFGWWAYVASLGVACLALLLVAAISGVRQ